MKEALVWPCTKVTLAAGTSWATARAGGEPLLHARGDDQMLRLCRELDAYWREWHSSSIAQARILDQAKLAGRQGAVRLMAGPDTYLVKSSLIKDFSNWIAHACGSAPLHCLDDYEVVAGGRHATLLGEKLAGDREGLCRFSRLCRELAASPARFAGVFEARPLDDRRCLFGHGDTTITIKSFFGMANHDLYVTDRTTSHKVSLTLSRTSLLRLAQRLDKELFL